MLAISVDRIMVLLDKAEEVDLLQPMLADGEADAEDNEIDEPIDVLMGNDPAYRALRDSVTALTPDEAYDLIALALLARSAADLDEWQAMREQARVIPVTELSEEVLETLVLTDDIELALEILGYGEEEEDEDVDERESDKEEGEDE